MTRSEETYLRWIKEAEASRSMWIIGLVNEMIEHLGKEKATEILVKQTYEMAGHNGEQLRQYFMSQGLENSLQQYKEYGMSEESVYTFAWKGGLVLDSDDEMIIEWTKCPMAAGYKGLGSNGVEIGEILCSHLDNAFIQKYNPKYECIRESSLNVDGLCRLHFKLKE